MAQIQIDRGPSKTWLGILCVAAVVAGGVAWWHFSGGSSTETMTPGVAGSASAAVASMAASEPPPTPASAAVYAGVMAEQTAVAKQIEQDPLIKPYAGEVKDKPSFLSDMEWSMLQGVANQQAAPAKALTQLVNTVRFNKLLELWQGLPTSGEAAKRQVVAEQLLDDLPTRVQAGDVEQAEALKLQPQLLADVVHDPRERAQRASQEAKRLPPAPTP